MLLHARKPVGPGGRGFTLLELMAVMTIITISSFALRPVFLGAIRNAEKRAALRDVVGLLSSARTQAVAQGKLVRGVCALDEAMVWAEIQVNPMEDRSQFEALPLMGRERLRLPDHLVIIGMEVAGQEASESERNEIYFFPDGRTDGATLVLMDSADREVVIDLTPATGRVRIRA